MISGLNPNPLFLTDLLPRLEQEGVLLRNVEAECLFSI